MGRYAAFLRGINISGKNRVPMSRLKAEMEKAGFSDVVTVLNSGNVTFTADEADHRQRLQELILRCFGLEVPVYVIPMDELRSILTAAPEWWDTGDKGQYDNLIFILSQASPQEISEHLGPPTEGLERFMISGKVIFWSFDRGSYMKCAWWKRTASAGIAETLTIRTAGTVKKLCRQKEES